MAKAKKQATTVVKWKKKKFYPIITPSYLGERVIGETPVADPGLLVSRRVTVNLMSVSSQPNKKDINVSFEITGIQDAKAQTNFVKYEVMPASTKRLVRRDRTKIDCSFVAVTKDEVAVRLKPMLLTSSKANKSVKKALIIETQRFTAASLAKKKYSEVVTALLQDTLSRELMQRLRKIHPLRVCIIRSFYVEKAKQGKAAVQKPVEEEAEEVTEETVEEPVEEEKSGTAVSEELEQDAEPED